MRKQLIGKLVELRIWKLMIRRDLGEPTTLNYYWGERWLFASGRWYVLVPVRSSVLAIAPFCGRKLLYVSIEPW